MQRVKEALDAEARKTRIVENRKLNKGSMKPGTDADGAAKTEFDHFMKCPGCGESVRYARSRADVSGMPQRRPSVRPKEPAFCRQKSLKRSGDSSVYLTVCWTETFGRFPRRSSDGGFQPLHRCLRQTVPAARAPRRGRFCVAALAGLARAFRAPGRSCCARCDLTDGRRTWRGRRPTWRS